MKLKKKKKLGRRKKRILCWSDSPAVSTGFGVVTKHIIGGLQRTGKYDIHQLAINHDGRFVDDSSVPWQLQPAKLLDPSDPYGNQMLINAVMKNDYDLIWILNDNYVTTGVASTLQEARTKRVAAGLKAPIIVYYYPVDCQVVPEGSKMLEVADICVAYTKHGRQETIKAMPHIENKIREIPHGVSSSVFKPLDMEASYKYRKEFFNVDSDTYVIGNFNRNTTRKQLPYTFFAFQEFRKIVPKSILYVHAAYHDQGGDMLLAAHSLGFSTKTDIIFPVDYGPGNAVPEKVLNCLYNATDIHLSTHLGEGWGLSCKWNTYINTHAGIKYLKDISIGDMVLTGDGTYQKVLDTTSREESLVYKLKPRFSPEIVTSDLHPYLASKDGGKTLQWLNVKQLKVGDYICVVKPKDTEEIPTEIDLSHYVECKKSDDKVWYKMGYSPNRLGLSISKVQKEFSVSKRVAEDALSKFRGKSVPSRCLPGSEAWSVLQRLVQKYSSETIEPVALNRFIPVDNNFLEFIGRYLAEGSSENGIRVELSFHRDEEHIARKFQRWCKESLGISSSVEVYENKSRLRISSSILASFFQQECGKGAYNKHIPSWLIKTPTKLGPVLKGLILGDGHFTESGYFSLSTTSPSLAYQTRDVCASVGILASIAEQKVGIGDFVPNVVSFKHRERLGNFIGLSLKKEKKPIDCIELDDYFLVPIESITKSEDNKEPLYDICVKNTHSFVANGILAHNSLSESMSAGVPTVVGNNTCMPQLMGENEERGYMYPCNDRIFIDNCYTPDTEVLTYSGWKLFKDLSTDDKICTLNPDNHSIEYYKPSDIIEGDYEGDLYSLKHNGKIKTDILVTKNHNIYAGIKQRNSIKWQLFKPRDVEGRKDIYFKKDAIWHGEEMLFFLLPPIKTKSGRDLPAKKISMDLWMEFMGYYLSEGSVILSKGSHFQIQLRQNPGALLDKMSGLLREMGFHPHINRDKPNSGVRVYSEQLYSYLKPLGKRYEKYIPRELLKCSSRQLKILFEAMMLGDGHNLYYNDYEERESVNTKGGSSYATYSTKLRDDFQELLLKIGYSGRFKLQTKKGTPWKIEGRDGLTNYDLWVVGISYKLNTFSRKGRYYEDIEGKWQHRDPWEEKWIPYKGKVYCATVPNQIMYIRRNGCVLWSGNSGPRAKGLIPDILDKVMEVYNTGDKINNPKVKLAREWAIEHDWSNIVKYWISLLDEVFHRDLALSSGKGNTISNVEVI